MGEFDDELAKSIEELLMEDGDPTIRENENLLEVEEVDDGDTEDDAAEEDDGVDAGDASDDEDDSDDGGATEEEDDSDDDEGDKSDEHDDDEDDEEEDGTDEVDEKPSKANTRIRKLISEKKEMAEQLKAIQAQLDEAEHRSGVSTPEHPDPDAEFKDLKEQYSRVKTAAQIVSERMVNPLTGQVYTPAEAQAAVAELKQDLQFKMTECRDSAVARMNAARESEQLADTMREPLMTLISKYPQLDKDNENYDAGLGMILQSVIDANAEMEGGLLKGFKESPEKVLKNFEKVLESQSAIKVNQVRKTDKKTNKMPTHGALDRRSTSEKKKSDIDILLDEFDAASKELGYNG